MTGMKQLLFGFLLVFTGIGLFAILCIPDAPLILAGIFTNGPTTPLGQSLSQAFNGYETTVHIVGGIAFILLVGGLVSATLGLLRKDSQPEGVFSR